MRNFSSACYLRLALNVPQRWVAFMVEEIDAFWFADTLDILLEDCVLRIFNKVLLKLILKELLYLNYNSMKTLSLSVIGEFEYTNRNRGVADLSEL